MPSRPKTKPAPENPNAFKHAVGLASAQRLANELASVYPSFDSRGLLSEARRGLEPLELKPRIRLLCDAMAARLPDDYAKALPIVLRSMGPAEQGGTSSAFFYWVHASFVEHYGLEHVELSLRAMREITQRSTAEFAVRPYLERDLPRVLAFLAECAVDPNPHVRRWASEGTRPFLPWGKRVKSLLALPAPSLTLLEQLRGDSSLYVRTSVANHLNDLSKLHPSLAVDTVSRWIEADVPHSAWVAKRALRGLVKAGHAGALAVFGVSSTARVSLSDLALEKSRLRVGDSLAFQFSVLGRAREQLVIDYALTFPGARERSSRKVFKLTQLTIEKGERVDLKKRHSFRPITTRVYRAGTHQLEILVNGKALSRAEFSLTL
jgi:3-methyladenine DNA glycosylase AlkC